MPLRLQKKASRVARAVVEEFNVARGVGTRTDKRGNAKTSLWDHGKVRRGRRLTRGMGAGTTRVEGGVTREGVSENDVGLTVWFLYVIS